MMMMMKNEERFNSLIVFFRVVEDFDPYVFFYLQILEVGKLFYGKNAFKETH